MGRKLLVRYKHEHNEDLIDIAKGYFKEIYMSLDVKNRVDLTGIHDRIKQINVELFKKENRRLETQNKLFDELEMLINLEQMLKR